MNSVARRSTPAARPRDSGREGVYIKGVSDVLAHLYRLEGRLGQLWPEQVFAFDLACVERRWPIYQRSALYKKVGDGYSEAVAGALRTLEAEKFHKPAAPADVT